LTLCKTRRTKCQHRSHHALKFIRERQIVTNVTPSTVEWYRQSLCFLPSESPSLDDLKNMVMRMRETRSAVGCNSAIRAINGYLHWNTVGLERKCGPGCVHPRAPKLKEPQVIMPTFTMEQVKRMVAWRPKAKSQPQRRMHVLTLILLDTGCRISEALGERPRDIDLDNLLMTLDGKGRKQRVVPFSFILRKALYYITDFGRKPDSLLLVSRNETPLGDRDCLRDVKLHCRRLGFEPPRRTLHAFRHTFAIEYLRRGGSVFHLQKILGHTSLEMTRKYINLVTADLQAVHERVSLLAA
jgi:integrase/recombinase XerD